MPRLRRCSIRSLTKRTNCRAIHSAIAIRNPLRCRKAADTKFATQHPYVDTGAKLAGGAAAMVPAIAAAPGLLGATGGLASRATMGGLSNAVLGGTDAAIRGGDPLSAAGLGRRDRRRLLRLPAPLRAALPVPSFPTSWRGSILKLMRSDRSRGRSWKADGLLLTLRATLRALLTKGRAFSTSRTLSAIRASECFRRSRRLQAKAAQRLLMLLRAGRERKAGAYRMLLRKVSALPRRRRRPKPD